MAAARLGGELVFDGKMWLFGGYTPTLSTTSGYLRWCFVEKTGTVLRRAAQCPVNLVYKDKMWLVTNDGILYSSPDGRSGHRHQFSSLEGRYAMAVLFSRQIWVMGGNRKRNQQRCLVFIGRYRLEARNSRSPWSKRRFSAWFRFSRGNVDCGGGITFISFQGIYRCLRSSDDEMENITKKRLACENMEHLCCLP